jgi:hypothetical protein
MPAGVSIASEVPCTIGIECRVAVALLVEQPSIGAKHIG